MKSCIHGFFTMLVSNLKSIRTLLKRKLHVALPNVAAGAMLQVLSYSIASKNTEWTFLCWVDISALSGHFCTEWTFLYWVDISALSGHFCTEWTFLYWVDISVLSWQLWKKKHEKYGSENQATQFCIFEIQNDKIVKFRVNSCTATTIPAGAPEDYKGFNLILTWWVRFY